MPLPALVLHYYPHAALQPPRGRDRLLLGLLHRLPAEAAGPLATAGALACDVVAALGVALPRHVALAMARGDEGAVGGGGVPVGDQLWHLAAMGLVGALVAVPRTHHGLLNAVLARAGGPALAEAVGLGRAPLPPGFWFWDSLAAVDGVVSTVPPSTGRQRAGRRGQ